MVPSVAPNEWPCSHEAFSRYLQLLKGLDGDDVEARAPVDEGLGDGDTSDRRSADEGVVPMMPVD